MDESVDDIFCIGVGGDVDLGVFFADCLVVINFAVVGEAPPMTLMMISGESLVLMLQATEDSMPVWSRSSGVRRVGGLRFLLQRR